MSFSCEELHLRFTEQAHAWAGMRDPKGFMPNKSKPSPIPLAPARSIVPEPLPPFSNLMEINCQDCGGRGYDAGSVNPREPEDCVTCHLSGKETILRNYLAEAFRIVADPETKLELERAHLVALTAYARQTVTALMSTPEVA